MVLCNKSEFLIFLFLSYLSHPPELFDPRAELVDPRREPLDLRPEALPFLEPELDEVNLPSLSRRRFDDLPSEEYSSSSSSSS